MNKLALTLLLSALVGSTLAQERIRSAVQKEVWEREETYWKMVAARDAGGYLELWDEGFIGWPSFEKSPVGKDSFRKNSFGPTIRQISSYKFEQKEVQVYGETGITFLQVRLTRQENGQSSERVIRLTHAWQKRNGKWHIVSGMPCVVNAEGLC